MPGNIRHDLVGSIFSYTASPVGDIKKAWVHFYMGASKYLPHYKISCGKRVLGLHIFYSNRSSRVVNLRGLDKYGSKYTGSRKNVQAKIRETYRQMRTDGVYIREGTSAIHTRRKRTRRQIYENSTFE